MWVIRKSDLQILETNESATLYYGYDRKELLLKKFTDLESNAKVEPDKKSNIQGKISLKKKDGEVVFSWILSTSLVYMQEEVYIVKAIPWEYLQISNSKDWNVNISLSHSKK